MDVAGYIYIYIRIWACFCWTRWKLSFCFLSGKPSRWTRQLVDEMRCIEHDLMAIQAQQQQQHQPIAFWFGSGFLRSLTRYRQSQGEKLEYPLTFLNIAHRYIGLPVSLTNLRTSPIETCYSWSNFFQAWFDHTRSAHKAESLEASRCSSTLTWRHAEQIWMWTDTVWLD